MADNYLITGYWGEPHVTAENDRGINAAMFGTGRFVLPVGEQFRAEYIGNNTIRMYDGKLMDNGAAAGIPVGEYVDLLIANAGQGMKRNDLIVFQYSQDSSTLVESGVFTVIQGAETSGTASDPALTQEDLLSGEAAFDQFALWRVSVSGATISAPVKLFSVYQNNVDHAADKNNPHKVTAAQTGAPTMAYAKQVGAPFNLLDNSDFRNPVNQRGLTTHTTNGATIDRWNKNDNIASVDVVAGGVSVTAKSGNYGYFEQKKENGTMLGKKLTFAVKTKNGLYVITGECPTSATSESVQFGGGMFDGFRMYMRLTADVVSFQVRIDAGKTIVFEWAAVYEGEYTVETLPEYQPKGYAAELLECQRYFYKLHGVTVDGAIWGDGGGATFSLFTPVPMRLGDPTLTNVTFGTVRANGKSFTPTNVSCGAQNANKMHITANGTFTGAGNHAAALFGFYADLSADL